MTIFEIAKKLHYILNETDTITSEHLDATIAIGNISLLECDDSSEDNIYIYISESLAECFDSGLYGSSGSFHMLERTKEAEKFLNSLRIGNELVEWFFPSPFLIFVKMVDNGYLSYEVDKHDFSEKHREEYVKWRTTMKEL